MSQSVIPGNDLASTRLYVIAGGMLLLSLFPRSIPRNDYQLQSTWTLEQRLGNDAKLEFSDQYREEIHVRLDFVRPDSKPEEIRLSQVLEIPSGSLVRMSFRAKAESSRTIECRLADFHFPRSELSQPTEFSLTEDWAEYSHEFRVVEGRHAGSLEFLFGGSPHSCWLADVVIVTESDADP
ncbi:MAG: hypothetical protein U1D30_10150 [Planctomycetota bacterium]